MIFFNNNKKHSFDIDVEKKYYRPGEQVKGTLVFHNAKSFIAKETVFKAFYVKGTEYAFHRDIYSEGGMVTNCFDFMNYGLSNYLSSIKTNLLPDRKIEIPKQDVEMPFEFTIPCDALESYGGSTISVSYSINAIIDRFSFWSDPISKTVSFLVIPNYSIYRTERKIVDIQLQTGFFSVRGKIEIEGILHRGTKVKAKLFTEEKVRSLSFRLLPIEYATIDGKSYRSTRSLDIHKCDQKIELSCLTNIERSNEKIEQIGMSSNNDKVGIIPFEIYVPENIRSSYSGHISQLQWKMHFKLDLPDKKDLQGISDIIEIL